MQRISEKVQLSSGFTREDMIESIDDAISNSIDMDWTSRDGAEAAVNSVGLFELYEIADRIARSGFGISQEYRRDLETALDKVRSWRS